MDGKRPPRLVALANGGVAALILVVVAAFGVAVSQSSPPSIAAFAPEVQQHANQKSLSGEAAAGALGAAAPTGVPSTPNPTANAPASNRPGTTPTPNPLAGRPPSLHCAGSPPHQTEDPQSPPCLQSFEGDNGGATSPGVTRTTVYVAWPEMQAGFPGVENEAYTTAMVKYFNSHFQLYGRSIELVPTTIAGGNNAFVSPDAQQMAQDADKAAREIKPGTGVFASLGYAPVGGTGYYYYDRLAQDGVLSVQSSPLLVPESHLASSPYLWSTGPGYDTVERNLANLYCHQLRGRPPQYAGPPTPPQTSWGTRRIAVFYETSSNNVAIDPRPFVDALGACGVQATAQALSDDDASYTAAVNAMQQGQQTTVACMCSPTQIGKFMNNATNQAFFPEWLVSNEQFLAADSSPQQWPSAQQGHVIGVDFNNEMLDPQNEFWWRAVKDADPGQAYQQNRQQQYAYYRYEELLLLASGIQQAGPRLTPQSFQQGLYDTRYGNVGHGAAPYYQAQVGFGPGAHSFYQDAAAVWFSPSAQSYTTGQGQAGAYCYSHGGDRGSDWTAPQPAFYDTSRPCRGG
jgi:hypothetical protein